ncbi:MAG: fumarylacetoacetase [Planctomycetota bacterium]
MTYKIDDTHDPDLESWIETANDSSTDFPIQNLPFCAVNLDDEDEDDGDGGYRTAVRIGDELVLLDVLVEAEILDEDETPETWWELCMASPEETTMLRRQLSQLFRKDNDELRDDKDLREACMLDADDPEIYEGLEPDDYTDFYASAFHATNVGSMFRPDNPLLPNYKRVPIGYHGRSSSIVASGTEIPRPVGQLLPGATIDDGEPILAACKMLDYELEMGAVIRGDSELGEAIALKNAEARLLGLTLVNDWSARDIQKWEYQPLGPFLAKNFATTVGPFVVSMEALAPFRCAAMERAAGDPEALAYLKHKDNDAKGGFDITVEAYIRTAQMQKQNMSSHLLSTGSFKHMYWTLAQMLTHHAVGGCNMQSGDLIASGTISGPARENRGCLLELTWDGDPFATPPVAKPGSARTPINLPTGESRKFLEDGDEVILRAHCEADGYRRIGFGECRGTIAPARKV